MNTKKSLLQRYLLLKPTKRAKFEFALLIPIAIIGLILSLGYDMFSLPFVPYTNVAGLLLLGGSLWFHFYCERTHTQSHDEPHEIKSIITEGVYSVVRHPINFSMMITHLSVTLISGSYLPLIVSLMNAIALIFISIEEEKALVNGFGNEYIEYMKKTKWRMIPFVY
jgi:protein-S-isoprenylcysteine O-methyltransferase Ste14